MAARVMQALAAGTASRAAQATAPVLATAVSRGLVAAPGSLFHGFSTAAPQPKPSDGASTSGQQQASASSTAGAGAGPSGGPSPEEMARQAFESIKSGYESAKSKFEDASGASSSSGGAGPASDRARSLFQTIATEVRATLMPPTDVQSATRKYTGPVATAPDGPYTGTSSLVLRKREQTAWEKAWDSVQDKMEHLPFFKKLVSVRVKDTKAFKKGQELVDDLKDKYETSDNPVVHKVEEVKERLFTGSEASRAMMEIRIRDPDFDINRFARSIKVDAPVVTKAFLRHEMDTLQQHCGKEILERFSGIFKHFEAEGTYEDPTILHVGDVEIVEVRLVDEDPFIIAQFHCQQLKCTRDKFGNVIEGSTDSIQRVYYFWGLQQEKNSTVTADGKVLPPRWVIKDMMWQSMLALV